MTRLVIQFMLQKGWINDDDDDYYYYYDLNEATKSDLLDKCKEILPLVTQQTDAVLKPRKPSYDSAWTKDDIFNLAGINKEAYYSALSISPDSNYELHLKRPVDSWFINNYFVAGINGFPTNVDLQPVFNHNKCVRYLCSYFTKHETECSLAIIMLQKTPMLQTWTSQMGWEKLELVFSQVVKLSSQKRVYRCMPELWLRKIFPATVFVSTDLPGKRERVTKSQQELEDESTDIFKSNIIDRYSLRPLNIPAVNDLCLAEFAALYC